MKLTQETFELLMFLLEAEGNNIDTGSVKGDKKYSKEIKNAFSELEAIGTY